jgi:hypothetical protein
MLENLCAKDQVGLRFIMQSRNRLVMCVGREVLRLKSLSKSKVMLPVGEGPAPKYNKVGLGTSGS